MTNKPQSLKFYTANDEESIAYNTVDEIADWLAARPEHIIGYRDTIFRLCGTFHTLGDYVTMRETLNFVVDVLIAVDERTGRTHRKEKPA